MIVSYSYDVYLRERYGELLIDPDDDPLFGEDEPYTPCITVRFRLGRRKIQNDDGHYMTARIHTLIDEWRTHTPTLCAIFVCKGDWAGFSGCVYDEGTSIPVDALWDFIAGGPLRFGRATVWMQLTSPHFREALQDYMCRHIVACSVHASDIKKE